MSDAFALDRLAEALRAELRNRHLVGAECRSGEQEWEVDDVKHRRRVEIDRAFLVWHPVVEKVDVLKDICVTQRDTFGTAGCTACIDESQDRVWVIDGDTTVTTGNVQWFFVDHALPRGLHGRDGERRVPNRTTRT